MTALFRFHILTIWPVSFLTASNCTRLKSGVCNSSQTPKESWNADKLKTDQFIQLVKRYTDFSELTTPMLNEFIEKMIVHEGEGRGMCITGYEIPLIHSCIYPVVVKRTKSVYNQGI